MLETPILSLVRCAACQQPRSVGEYRIVRSKGERDRRRRVCRGCERRYDELRATRRIVSEQRTAAQARIQSEIEARILKLDAAIRAKGRYLTPDELDQVLEPIPTSKPASNRQRDYYLRRTR